MQRRLGAPASAVMAVLAACASSNDSHPEGGTSDASPSVDAPSGGDAAAKNDLRPNAMIVHSFDGQYCSTSVDENPFNICAPGNRFVCISTRSAASDAGTSATHLCRVSCDPAGAACPVAGDVCCAGDVYGEGGPRGYACAPPAQCAER